MTGRYVLGLEEIGKTQVALVGGKGASLGELSRIEGVRVPAGFCVTTGAFRRIMTTVPWIDDQLDRLSRLDPGDREAIRTLSAQIRRTVEAIAIPDDLTAAITRSVTRLGGRAAYAVRSSATAEDLPTASFAGQQDTYLNVVGLAAVLRHVSRCWASLFTERAVSYRLRNGFGHRKVHMAVVVQRMLLPQAAGVLFTADPVTSNRKVVSIEASFGLGEALVAGGRLFVDVTQELGSPASRARILNALGRSDPLIGDALQTILERGDFILTMPDEGLGGAPADSTPAPIETDPAIPAGLVERAQASIATLKRDIRTKSGPAAGPEEGTGTAGAVAVPAGRGAEGRTGRADDRPDPGLHRVPGVSQVPHGQPLLRLQAGLAG
jgi:Pyruvate phosphate dikinase, AMP/ATP-binding domain